MEKAINNDDLVKFTIWIKLISLQNNLICFDPDPTILLE